MKSLFNTSDNIEIISRINTLSYESKAEWGKMHVSQMLAHCQVPIKVAFGETKLKRSFLGILFGGIAKKQSVGEVPFKKNLPTDKGFLIKEIRDFDQERYILTELIKRFAEQGKKAIVNETHPFFGKLNVDEWDKIMFKHVDHHLRQFGV